jgi:hypothetical protein
LAAFRGFLSFVNLFKSKSEFSTNTLANLEVHMLILWIVLSLIAAVILWLGFWSLVTLLVGMSARQAEFVKGSVSGPAPNGFFNGSAYLLGGGPVPWLGKSFDSANSLGFNIFTPKGASLLKLATPLYKLFRVNGEGNTDAYFFKTRTGPALKDPSTDVIKLDYDTTENPFLIRIILDEIVETSPNEYLGKVHLKVFPGIYSTIGFFGLRQPSSASLE